MGGLCSPNLATSLMSQYGQGTILKYVQSMVGQQIIGSQFGGLTNTITQLFNSNPQTRGNTGLLNNIIQSINGTRDQQTQNIMRDKPSIPELDNLSPEKRNGIISGFQNQFSSQMGTFKSGLMNQLAPSLDPTALLSKFGLGNLAGAATSAMGMGGQQQGGYSVPSGNMNVSGPMGTGATVTYGGARY